MVWRYNLAVADVAAVIGHLGTITATTSPDATMTDRWITEQASDLNHVVRWAGVDPATIVATATGQLLEMYHRYRLSISSAVASRWIQANKGSDTEQSTALMEQYLRHLEQLRLHPIEQQGKATDGFQRAPARDVPRPHAWRHGRSYR